MARATVYYDKYSDKLKDTRRRRITKLRAENDLKLREKMEASTKRWKTVFEIIEIKYNRVFHTDEEEGEIIDLNDLFYSDEELVESPYDEVLGGIIGAIDENGDERKDDNNTVYIPYNENRKRVKKVKNR